MCSQETHFAQSKAFIFFSSPCEWRHAQIITIEVIFTVSDDNDWMSDITVSSALSIQQHVASMSVFFSTLLFMGEDFIPTIWIEKIGHQSGDLLWIHRTLG